MRNDDLLEFNNAGISPSRIIATTETGQNFDLCFLLSDPGALHQWEVVVLADKIAPQYGMLTALEGRISAKLICKTKDFDGGYWLQRHRFDGYRGLISIDQEPATVPEMLDQFGQYMHP